MCGYLKRSFDILYNGPKNVKNVTLPPFCLDKTRFRDVKGNLLMERHDLMEQNC